ncbi:hypothetical protein ABIC74_000757 [Mucilaginibacter rubeus]|uniref:RteC domain-containing protein n=1 Tax=Mucilaginibacter rubeus TaxID=2027860 RepID=UPI003391A53D
MLKSICDDLYQRLLAELSISIQGVDEEFTRLSKHLPVIKKYHQMVRLNILERGFKDEKEEIYFFKNIKPKFLSVKIFTVERYNIEQSKPVGTWPKQLEFYENEIEDINRFYRRYAFIYQYYRAGLSELDESYFIRGKEVASIFAYEVDEIFLEFSTWGDYIFSRFRACEMLQEFILEQIKCGSLAAEHKLADAFQSKPLNWTGESINLVELGYGLFDSGQLNNGKAGVNEIFKWLEEHFNISIGIPARRFVEIKRRKRLSRTRFLDNLRESVNRKIEEDEEYNPEKQQSRRNRQDN